MEPFVAPTSFQKKGLPGAFAGGGVNAVIRDGLAISGWGEGAPSVGAICSQIKITTRALRAGRSAAASEVIFNLRRIHFAKMMLRNKR